MSEQHSKKLTRRQALAGSLGAVAGAAAWLGGVGLAQEATGMIRLGLIGVGSRGTYLLRVALRAGVEVPALCDINDAHLNRAIAIVEKARNGRRPAGYSKGPKDYQRMLQRDVLDAVLVATPQRLHAKMSIDGLRAGKHVLSEVCPQQRQWTSAGASSVPPRRPAEHTCSPKTAATGAT